MRSASILAPTVLAAIVKLSLTSEAIVKLGLDSETCSSCNDDASVSLLQVQGSSLVTQGSSAIDARDEAPSSRVLFIRTHYTGSSALSTILRRHCQIRHKRCSPFLLFSPKHGYLSREALLDYASQHRTKHNVEIWEDHIKYAVPEVREAFDTIMPGAVRVSLFREPMSRLISGFEHDFFSAEMVQKLVADLKSNVSRSDQCHAINKQLSLSDIDVIALTEDYDRSLVLLAMKLGWPLEDLLYLRVRESPPPSQKHQHAIDELKAYLQKPASTLTDAGREFLKVCYLDDLAQYNAANRTYHKQLDAMSPSQHAEVESRVARLQSAFKTLTTCCEEAPEESDQYCEVMERQGPVRGQYPEGWLETPCRRKALQVIRA